VFNRFRGGAAPVDIGTEKPIAVIPDDSAVEQADLAASPVSLISPGSPAGAAVRELAEKIRQMANKSQ
jgi:CO dehydrogenase maturation factor